MPIQKMTPKKLFGDEPYQTQSSMGILKLLK